MTIPRRSLLGWKFWLLWLLINSLGWPLGWIIGNMTELAFFRGLAVLMLIQLWQAVMPRELGKQLDWLRLSGLGLLIGFEIAWRAGYISFIDLLAVVAISVALMVAFSALLGVILLGPLWLLLAFASLICPAERAKWSGKLFPGPAQSLAARLKSMGAKIALYAVASMVGEVASLLAGHLGELAGWSMTSAQLNLVARAALGLAYGAITGLILRWLWRHPRQQPDQLTPLVSVV